jgi:hypothetical protein
MKLKSMPVSYMVLTVLALPVVLTVVLGAQILRRHFPKLPDAFSQNAHATGGAAESHLKVPCEEPPDQNVEQVVSKSPQDAKAPEEKVATAGGADTGEFNGHESGRSNYLTLDPVRSLLISDSQGHSEELLGQHPTGQKLKGVVYDRQGKNSWLISAPVRETYTVTFQSTGEAGTIELVRGVNNQFPDMAMRYNDLVLPSGVTARLKLTAQGIEPLQLDKDGDGTFETTIKPDGVVTGPGARDLRGPTICFGESKRGAKSLITIAAADVSGVSAIYYSLDAQTKDEMSFQLYNGPFEVEAALTPVVYAIADDSIGNRSIIYDFKVSR